MMRNVYKIIMLLIMTFVLISPALGDNSSIRKPVTYKTFVDKNQGFYQVYNVMTGKAIPYQDRTLNIYKGDTIVWVNDEPDKRLTIVSEQNLWNNKSGLLPWERKEFVYTFNKSGIYNVSIEEYPWQKQKIIVGPIDLNSTKNNTAKLSSTNSTKTNVTKQNNKSNISNITVPKINVIKSNSTNSTKSTKTNTSNATIMAPIGTTSKKMAVSNGFDSLMLVVGLSSLIYVVNRKIK